MTTRQRQRRTRQIQISERSPRRSGADRRSKNRATTGRSQPAERRVVRSDHKRSRSTSATGSKPGIVAHAPSPPRREGSSRRRLIASLVVLTVGLLAVLVRVGAIQTAAMGAELREEGARQWTRTAMIPAGRGTIFDRNGEELALSIPAATVSVNPKLVVDPDATLATLTAVLDLSDAKREELATELERRERGFVYVARQVDPSIGEQLRSLRLSGVDVVSEDRRVFPGGVTGRSVIGRTDIDGIGISGLELQFDDLLTGVDGQLTREMAPGGRSIPGTGEVTAAPIPGDDLMLTLDRSIQYACEEALIEQVERLGARGATCVVMDAPTGEIYAMASVRRNSNNGRAEVATGNFAVVDADEPGSVAKVITVAAALDAGLVNRNTSFVVPWREQYYDDLLSDAWQHPDETWTVEEIFTKSSNIGTIKIWERLGRERHWEYMRAFGLGEPTALDFPGESPGIFKHWSDLWGSERVTVSYGQGLASTSIQLAAAVNVVANNGVYVAPKLVRAAVDADASIERTPPSATHGVISAEAAEELTGIMAQSVCSGTATSAAMDHFTVAGKTGTGLKAQPNGTYLDENGMRTYYSSFVGFFPAEDPAVTLLISIDEPPATSDERFGGTAAGPVFARVAATIVHELGLQPPAETLACR